MKQRIIGLGHWKDVATAAVLLALFSTLGFYAREFALDLQTNFFL